MGPLPVTGSFNKYVWGHEIVYPGTVPMSDLQMRTALILGAVVAAIIKAPNAEIARGHAETSITGKWDPGNAPSHTIDLAWMRSMVWPIVQGQPSPVNNPIASPPVLPTLSYGMRNNSSVAHLQAFLNAYPWKPALPILPVTGNYLDQTKSVMAAAQVRMGVTGSDANGSIVGPRTNAALYQRGYRG